jgi:hypothetical protein
MVGPSSAVGRVLCAVHSLRGVGSPKMDSGARSVCGPPAEGGLVDARSAVGRVLRGPLAGRRKIRQRRSGSEVICTLARWRRM